MFDSQTESALLTNQVATICLCLLLVSNCVMPNAAMANSPPAAATDVDKELYVELVKLAAFNVHFQLEANKHQPWRVITYPLVRESGTALGLSATLIDLNQQADGLNDPRRISRNQLKNAARCAIIGNAISGAASASELAQNTWMMLKAKRNGFAPAHSLSYVAAIVAKTDKLLEAREELAKHEDSIIKRQVLELEDRLVRRIRSQLIYEFATWSAHSRDRAWRENSFYLVDSAQSFTRMSAGILALKAFSEPRLARPAAVCALVGTSLLTVNPITHNMIGFAIRKHQERVVKRVLPVARPEELEEQPELDANSPWLQRVALLTRRTEKIDTALNRQNDQIQKFRQIAQQQSISGPLIGLTGVTSSILATEAVFGQSDDIRTATRLGFSGRIVQGVGQAFSLVYTPIIVITGLRREKRLRAQGQLPSQILEQRLRTLEQSLQ